MLKQENSMPLGERIKKMIKSAGRGEVLFCGGVLLILAVFVRGVFLVQFADTALFPVAVGADTSEYFNWAKRILAGELLWQEVPIHAPLYPYFLAFLLWLTDMSIPAVRVIQAGVDVLAMGAVVAGLRALGCTRTAWLTGVIWAMYLPLVYISVQLLSESLLVPLISLGLLAQCLFFRSCGRRVKSCGRRDRSCGQPGGSDERQKGALVSRPLLVTAVLMGLFSGLAVITHPVTLFIPVLFAGLTYVAVVRTALMERGRGLLYAGTVLVVAFLVVAPVTLRNYQVSGEFILVQRHTALNMYIGNNPEATGTCYVRPDGSYEKLARLPERGQEQSVDTVSEARGVFLQKIADYVTSAPLDWAGLLGKKLLLTWNAVEIPTGSDLPFVRELTPLMRLPVHFFGILGPLALVGIYTHRRRFFFYPFIGVTAGYTILLTLLVTGARYRLGMLPALIALAAAGLAELSSSAARWTLKQRAIAAAVFAAGVIAAYAIQPPQVEHGRSEAYQLLAEANWRQRNLDRAEYWCRRAIKRRPEQTSSYHILGAIEAHRGDHQAAVRLYKQALEYAEGDVAEVKIDLANAWSRAGRTQRARRILENVVDEHPENAKAWYNLGVLAEKMQKRKRAMKLYQRALRHDAGFVSAHVNYGVLLVKQGNLGRARTHFQGALRLDPQKTMAYNGLAMIALRRGQVGDARRDLEQSLELDQDQPRIQRLWQKVTEQSRSPR